MRLCLLLVRSAGVVLLYTINEKISGKDKSRKKAHQNRWAFLYQMSVFDTHYCDTLELICCANAVKIDVLFASR